MKFRETALPGVYVIEQVLHHDNRGSFARTFCQVEYEAHGLDARVSQCSVSHNTTRGTLRGMHYQAPPHEETKTVRCTRGRAFDVVVDLRPSSPSFRGWLGVELSAGVGNAIYIPAGCAHGFMTLEDDTTLEYVISVPFVADAARGVRYDDPMLRIEWPGDVKVISPRDAALPSLAASAGQASS